MFMIDDIIKLLKANREKKYLESLQQDAKAAVTNAEQQYGAGHGEEKYTHALEELTAKGYDPEKDMLQAIIEATVYQMNQAKPKSKPHAPKVAKTASELKAKYGRRRFTSNTVGKAIIIDRIYRNYQISEFVTKKRATLSPGDITEGRESIKSLYPNIAEKVDTYSQESVELYEAHSRLIEWIMVKYSSMTELRDSLKFNLLYLFDTASGIMAGEELRHALQEQEAITNENIWLWLRALTIDEYTEQGNRHYSMTQLRDQILARNLPRVLIYNSFIELISEAISIPEFEVFKLSMQNVEDIIESLNTLLSSLQQGLRNYYLSESPDTPLSQINGKFTPEYLERSLKIFDPVELKAPPIPETLRQETTNLLKRCLTTENYTQGLKVEYNKLFDIFVIKTLAQHFAGDENEAD